jgi:hypothetical protein
MYATTTPPKAQLKQTAAWRYHVEINAETVPCNPITTSNKV